MQFLSKKTCTCKHCCFWSDNDEVRKTLNHFKCFVGDESTAIAIGVSNVEIDVFWLEKQQIIA